MTKHSIPKTTPWGEPQTTEILAPGIVLFSTASHGGIWLSPERNKQVPMRIKRRTFMGNGLRGWYEEDCDAEIVYRFFNFGLAPRCYPPEPVNRLAEITAKLSQQPQKLRTDEELLEFLNAHANGIKFTMVKKRN